MLRSFLFFLIIFKSINSVGTPNVCDVITSKKYSSCYNYKQSPCACPGVIPRPCARHKYRIPSYFIEVVINPAKSFFKDLPIKSYDMGSARLGGSISESDSQFYHVRIAPVTYAFPTMNILTCGKADVTLPCVIASSVALKSDWMTGRKDLKQPMLRLWKKSPKSCLKLGAANQTGESIKVTYPAMGFACGMKPIFKGSYPPSLRTQCTAWGNRYPRTGYTNNGVQLYGALLAGMRFDSLGNEVFLTVPQRPSNRWQMLYPKQSSCFKEGQGLFPLELKGVGEGTERLKDLSFNLAKKHGMYLFAVWKEVSCCRDLPTIATHVAAEKALIAACKGLKGGI